MDNSELAEKIREVGLEAFKADHMDTAVVLATLVNAIKQGKVSILADYCASIAMKDLNGLGAPLRPTPVTREWQG